MWYLQKGWKGDRQIRIGGQGWFEAILPAIYQLFTLMNYKGFTIIHSPVRGWLVRVSINEEWLSTSKEDAMRQVDNYLNRKQSKVA
jgi:hypothetical protein